MSTKKPKDVKAYANINLDELLSKLTTEQLEDLHTELIDPDDSMVPPCDRCRYKTDKLPTGAYNRKRLLDFLEKKAREEKDWEEEKPYTKEKRGKTWTPEKEEKIKLHDDDSMSTEWDEILIKASEAELVDLAAILGFHGMLNQVQYHQAFVEGKKVNDGSGFQSVAKYAEFKHFEADKPNDTDVEKCLEQMKKDDPELKEFNLNNIRKIKIEKLCEIAEALEKNTHLTKLYMANTRATDKVVKALINSLKTNKTLKELNLETNYISGSCLVLLIEAINVHQSITDLKISNQRPQTLGVQNEMQITRLIKFNQNLLRLNIVMETWSAKILVTRYIQRNIDNQRRKRMGIELVVPTEDEKPYYLKEKQKEADPPKEEDSSDDSGDSSSDEE